MNNTASTGWEHIEREFLRIYPGQNDPLHFAAMIKWRFGGNDPLDGISIYEGKDYWHFVTFGLSELYEKVSDNHELSGYGYEMTFKLKKDNYDDLNKEIRCVCQILQTLARITFQKGVVFGPNEFIRTGQTVGIDSKGESDIRGFICISDPSVNTIDTPNGKVAFIEMVGMTEDELLSLSTRDSVKNIYSKLGSDITDYKRKSVLLNVQAERMVPDITSVSSSVSTTVTKSESSPEENPEQKTVSSTEQDKSKDDHSSLRLDTVQRIKPEGAKHYLKGERTDITDCDEVRISFKYDSAEAGADPDVYAFMLHENGKAERDEDLVFFGSKLSLDGAVEDLSVGNSHTVSFKPSQLSSDIYHVLVCFSVYGDDEKMNFSKIKNPATVIDLFGFGGSGEFKLELSSEKTVEVVEFYRHNDRIKMKTIGSGYFTGIEKLCEKLGIETQ